MSSWAKQLLAPMPRYRRYSAHDPIFQKALQICHDGPRNRPDLWPLDHNNPTSTTRWSETTRSISKTYTAKVIDNDNRRLDWMLAMAWVSVNVPPDPELKDFPSPGPLLPLHEALRQSYATLYQLEIPGSYIQGYCSQTLVTPSPAQVPAAVPAPMMMSYPHGTRQLPWDGINLREIDRRAHSRCTNCDRSHKGCSGVIKGQQAGEGMRCNNCKDNQQCVAMSPRI